MEVKPLDLEDWDRCSYTTERSLGVRSMPSRMSSSTFYDSSSDIKSSDEESQDERQWQFYLVSGLLGPRHNLGTLRVSIGLNEHFRTGLNTLNKRRIITKTASTESSMSQYKDVCADVLLDWISRLALDSEDDERLFNASDVD